MTASEDVELYREICSNATSNSLLQEELTAHLQILSFELPISLLNIFCVLTSLISELLDIALI